MDWFYPKRRGPEWKQGWTSQALASAAAPPAPLLAIFGIVMVLLWLSVSGYTEAQMQHTSLNFQLFLILVPILLILFMVLFSAVGSKFMSFGLPRQRVDRKEAVLGGGGASPWGVAVVVAVVLVLMSYQSSFHSKWFGAN